MPTIKEYCLGKGSLLVRYTQQPFPWQDSYDLQQLCLIDRFAQIQPDIPGTICRQDILDKIATKSYYTAFVMCMLWGGIGKRPGSNKRKMTEIAWKAFSDCDSKPRAIFELAVDGSMESVKELYELLDKGGALKIPEVDVSYFTKLIAFGSEVSGENFKFLIYDKWTKLIHVHLMYDQSEEPGCFYTPKSINKLHWTNDPGKPKRTDLIYPKSNRGWSAYLHYCEAMAHLSYDLSRSLGENISASKLESFLFGKDLRGRHQKTAENPRYWIQQNFARQYSGSSI